MKNKYMFLYLRTGGGHYAPARAVADMLERTSPGFVETVMIDGLQGAPSWTRIVIEDGYTFLQAWARWYYGFIYFITHLPPLTHFWMFMVGRLVRPSLERRILEEQPAQIAIFHAFLIKPVVDILKKHHFNIPVLVVVTDPYSAHPAWFLNKDLRFVVFSDRLKQYCLSSGIGPSRVMVFPGIVNERFTEPVDQGRIVAVRHSLGIKNGENVILLIGGKDGIPNGINLTRSLLRDTPDVTLIAVCGKNERMFKGLTNFKERYHRDNLIVLGHSDDVASLFHLSDIVVTKCGASICMELLITKKITIVHRYIPGQEKGNVDYLTDNHFGFYEPRTKNVARRISKLLETPALMESIIDNIEQAKIQNGAPFIAEYMLTLNPSIVTLPVLSPGLIGKLRFA